MNKGENTKRRILEQTTPLFNQRGFRTTSMSEIMEATGLQKGGVYNHFRSKEQMALQAFDHATSLLRESFPFVAGQENRVDALRRSIERFRNHRRNSPLTGGCPLLNSALESDDAFPALHAKCAGAVKSWHSQIKKLVVDGKRRGEVRLDADASRIASIVISGLEGGIFLDRLFPGSSHLSHCCDHLLSFVEDQRANPSV